MSTTLITALDLNDLPSAMAMVDRIGPAGEWYKVGKQLFTRCGAEVVRELKAREKKVFLDLKYHDIPNTVEQAVLAAADIGADLCNVHALGGPTMLRAAAKAAQESGIQVVAVTVLTSMDQAELDAIGIERSPAETVMRLAKLTQDCGLPGVVCSAREIALLQQTCGKGFTLVVPGIRPAGSAHGDQKRVTTPRDAARAKAQYIVVGRPILAAADPAVAALEIKQEIESC